MSAAVDLPDADRMAESSSREQLMLLRTYVLEMMDLTEQSDKEGLWIARRVNRRYSARLHQIVIRFPWR